MFGYEISPTGITGITGKNRKSVNRGRTGVLYLSEQAFQRKDTELAARCLLNGSG